MSGVVRPPKRRKPSRTASRSLTILFLVLVGGVITWAVVTDQRIGVEEFTSHSSLQLDEPITVEDLTLNVVEHQGGPIPVVFIHDIDVAGGSVFEAAIAELPARFRGVVIDLPGFGLSERVPGENSVYTVARMADVVAEVIDQRLPISAVLVGVGYGGEVASEVAVSHPHLVRGLVMVDVDFWPSQSWLEIGKSLPFLGRAIAFTFEGAGLMGPDYWSRHCDSGGWCPTEEQLAARAFAASIEGSTDSLLGYKATLPSSLVPTALDEVTAPVAYVWSTKGAVTQDTIDRIGFEIVDMQVIESDSWMAHLDAPAVIAVAVDTVSP